MSDFCQLWLSCADKAEASHISAVLLEKNLVACAKQVPISADFHWQEKVDHAEEVLLIMESRAKLFDEIEKAVSELHSYETFVLEATPIIRVSKKAEAWLNKSLEDG